MPLVPRLTTALLVAVFAAGCAASPEPAAFESAVAPVTATVETAGPAEERPVVRALRILRRWDRSRAAAYASGDVGLLRSLYSRASRAGAEDARMLRRYADRGLVVEGLTVQVVRADLVASSATRVRLRVVERLAGGTVVGEGPDMALPVGQLQPRLVTLVDVRGRWVVRAVRRG